MSRKGPGREVTAGHGRGVFRRNLDQLAMGACDGAARNQSIARNKFVAIVLGSLSALRSAGRIGATDSVHAKKATYHSSHARKVDDQQAAHAVPGHVWVADQDLTLLAPNQAAKNMLLDLFAYCNHVSALVNGADSLAEQYGMRQAFADACEQVVRTSDGREASAIDDAAVESAYRTVWCQRAGAAYARAIASLEGRFPPIVAPGARRLPDGTIEPYEPASEEEHDALVKRDVLRIYLRDLAALPNRLERAWMGQLEAAFRDAHVYPI
jgi:hypothetical protein